jgi:hypothetical protein
MNVQTLSTAFVPVLFGMVLVWFVLVKLLFNRLESAHPAKYEAMGRPSLFLRNTIEGGWHLFKFLFTREHRSLNDSYLSKLSDGMLVFFSIYLLIFVGLFVAVATAPGAA